MKSIGVYVVEIVLFLSIFSEQMHLSVTQIKIKRMFEARARSINDDVSIQKADKLLNSIVSNKVKTLLIVDAP